MTNVRIVVAGAILAGTVAIAANPASGSHTDDPTDVVIAGNLQDELGCPGDWQPECTATGLTFDADDDVWQATFAVPAGSWEYKAPLNLSWDENYGAGGVRDGDNIQLAQPAAGDVKFYYDHKSHWVTDDVNSTIATAAGSFQGAIGCLGDWDPACLRSWLQDLDGDGVYSFSTTAIPAGSYEFKVAIAEGWDENYGQDGISNGANVPFEVANDGAAVTINWDEATKIPSVSVGGLEPGDEALVSAPIRQPGADDFVYMVMTDRFENGDTGNDTGGSPSSDREVHGLDATDKGFYHGGDIAGMRSKLDYLQGLGVTALWMTPAFQNRWVQETGTANVSAGYHGYWQVDLTTIDPHLGSNDEMKDLISDAQSRGMKVYFDVVTNHTGDVIQYVGGDTAYRNKTDYPYRDADGNIFDDRDFVGTGTFPPLDADVSFPYVPTFATAGDESVKQPDFLDDPTLYHNRGNSSFTGENSLYGDFVGLDDLFTEHPDVVSGMTDAHKAMITTFGVDGFRVDTVKHVNDEFWDVFVPEIRTHAAAEGKPDFVLFGEVFDSDPEFLSRFSTELPFPATLDFRFDQRVKGTAAFSGATDGLRDMFADDDWFTDDDSNAYGLVKFVGNHDIGHVGNTIDAANPGAADAERVARAELVQALNFLTRGTPVIYYGDEQGFTGDGGDQDARQDMFPSQVPSYNDDDLIGTADTTADANFDTTHPLYQTISDLAQLRDAAPNEALRTGAQLHRYSEGSAGIYAFSRIDRNDRVEYVVAVNTSEATDSATFGTDTPAATFTQIYPGTGGPISSDAAGQVTVEVPALDVVVYRADSPVPTDDVPDGIAIVVPAGGSELAGRTEVRAEVTPGTYAEVTFAVSVDGGPYEVIGTDDNAPYRVFHDVGEFASGTSVTYKAIVADLGGNLNADKVTASVAEPPPDSTTRPYAVIHYLRDDGDYGDHTTGDYNDFWGLHLWDGIDETIEWTSPKPFLGEDEYGRFAWVKLTPDSTNVGFIVHRGDTKDGTPDDRFFDPSQNPEIWLRQDDGTTYTSQAAAQGFATVHYFRPDGDYGDPTSPDYNDFWGLHLWGDSLAPGVGTDWTSPRPPDGTTDFGAFWNVPIADPSQPLNFIIHRGDTKDPGPDQSFVPEDDATVWIVSGDETIHAEKGAAQGLASLHYHRPGGDYGDYTSDDYNDFWGLHTWADAADPGWTTPRKPARFDVFGPVFDVPLINDRTEIGYLLHRGDEKDPGPDQSLNVKDVGYEVWQLQGADPADPYILPMASAGPVAPTADAGGSYNGNEGSPIALDGSGSTDDHGIVSYKWDCHDDGIFEISSVSPTGSSCTYGDNGSFTVKLLVTDAEGETDHSAGSVTISNVDPSIDSLSVNSPIDEDDTATLSGSYSDPGTLDTHVLEVDWDGDLVYDQSVAVADGVFSVSHQYLDDDPTATPSDTVSVNVRLTDDDTGSTTDSAALTVDNVDPRIDSLSTSATFESKAEEGEEVTVAGAFTDTGTLDTHSVNIGWGDGSVTAATVVQGAGSGTFSGGHVYATGGVFTVTVTLTDDDTGTATATTIAVVTGVGVNGGVLQIVGTNKDDGVGVTAVHGEIDVFADFVNLHHRRFDVDGVTSIEIYLGEGDDHGNIHPDISLPAEIHGGEGDDMLLGGSGDDEVYGGDGDDMLWGRNGDDGLYGGDGDDRLNGGKGDNSLDGGHGVNVLVR